MQEQRRVVVTGLGLVSPLGTGVEKNWQALMAGRSGIRQITRFATEAFAAELPERCRTSEPKIISSPKRSRKWISSFSTPWAPQRMAMADSGLKIEGEFAENVGVIIGVGLCGLDTIETTQKALLAGGPRKISPFFIPESYLQSGAGPCCDSSRRQGGKFDADFGLRLRHPCDRRSLHYDPPRIAGRSDRRRRRSGDYAPGVGGFAAMKALSTRNDEPERASRPFDKERDGFVIGEGSGSFDPRRARACAPTRRKNLR